MHKRKIIVLIALCALTVAACASQPYVDDPSEAPGFFMGLLHGFIAWFAIVGHIFDKSIRVYAYPNTGGWYDFGLLIGASLWGGGAGASASR